MIKPVSFTVKEAIMLPLALHRAPATAFERTWGHIGRRLASAHFTAAGLLFLRRGPDPLPSAQGVG
jgi:hypothetical protein